MEELSKNSTRQRFWLFSGPLALAPVEKLVIDCSLLSSYSLKSPWVRSWMYCPFLSVTTASTRTRRDSFLMVWEIGIGGTAAGSTAGFCAFSASAGFGGGALSCAALRPEMSKRTPANKVG